MPDSIALTAVADDLTGASEIAGHACQTGLRALVTIADAPPISAEADLTILDTDTRLSPADAAARHIAQLASRLRGQRPLFKKIDSVLRGPVAAEAAAFAQAANYSRILLVPAIPMAGRIIHRGEYLVHGQPLCATLFRDDPHHPAKSAKVLELVGSTAQFQTRSSAPGEPLPPRSLTIGDAARIEDLDRWAESVAPDTLVGGSAAFFAAWLRRQSVQPRRDGANPVKAESLPISTLVLSGTTVAAQRALLRSSSRTAWGTVAELEPDASHSWVERVTDLLRSGGHAIAAIDGPVVDVPARAARLGAAFAAIALRATQQHLAEHLVIEGGATAAAVLRALNWTTLAAVQEWTPGVVTLCPLAAPDFRVTLKPGSYPWPPSFTCHLFGS